jgi:UDP-glucose 4-epimerase
MRAMVTGGAGFIGSHVADALTARGDEVHVLDDLSSGRRENVPAGAELHVADIRDPGTVFEAVRPEVVFHLAAQASVSVSVAKPLFDAEVNVLGTVALLDAALAHGVGEQGAQLVFSSTGGAIYGECETPATEEWERRPLSPYGTSKLAGEEYLASWNRLHGTRHVALRYGNVYGPRQDPHGEAGVVAIFLQVVADGRRPTIFGDGSQERDYVYVGDVARATLAAAQIAGGVLNVATGRATSVLELVDAMRRATGREIDPEHGPERLGDLKRSVLDPTLAERDLGWRPEVSLEDGLRETWQSSYTASG